MSPSYYNGFIFQNESGKSLAVIEVRKNKYWGIEIQNSGIEGRSYYSDIGVVNFPAHTGNIVGSFNIDRNTLQNLLEARHELKKAYRHSRNYSLKRMKRMESIDEIIGKEKIAQHFGDIGFSDVQQAKSVLDYVLDTLFGEYLMRRM